MQSVLILCVFLRDVGWFSDEQRDEEVMDKEVQRVMAAIRAINTLQQVV